MRLKALLVTAEVDLLLTLRSELQRRGLMTLAARSADEALDLHQGISPDVVLLAGDLDDGPSGVLRGRLSATPMLLLAQLPRNAAEVAARAAALLAARDEPTGAGPARTPTVVLPAVPTPPPAPDAARVDTAVTDLGPAGARERDDNETALAPELEHPLYRTLVASPRGEGGGDDDDSYGGDNPATHAELEASFFDLALGQSGEPSRTRPPRSAPAAGRPARVSIPPTGPPAAARATQAPAGDAAAALRTPPPPPRAILMLDGHAVESGELAQVEFARLLCAIHSARLDGTLTCRRDPTEKAIAFREGGPIFATSNDPSDRLSDLLYREGRLTRAQRERADEALAHMQPGRRVGAVLMDLGFLKESELVPAVTRQLQTILYGLFGWDEGTFRFLAGPPAPGEVITLSTPMELLVLEGVRRKYHRARLQALLPRTAVLVHTPVLDGLIRALETGDDGRRLLQAVDGRRPVGVLAPPGARELDALRLLHCAVLLGGATLLADHGPAAAAATAGETAAAVAGAAGDAGEGAPRESGGRAGPGPGGTRPLAAALRSPPPLPAPARDDHIDRERLREKYRQVRSASYFEVLGVPPDATEYEVRRAYEALRATFGPEQYAQQAQRGADVREELEEVAAVLRDAYEVLSDDERRAAYADAQR
jgi:hypothetical protein